VAGPSNPEMPVDHSAQKKPNYTVVEQLVRGEAEKIARKLIELATGRQRSLLKPRRECRSRLTIPLVIACILS
jgi:hypothetical protein